MGHKASQAGLQHTHGACQAERERCSLRPWIFSQKNEGRHLVYLRNIWLLAHALMRGAAFLGQAASEALQGVSHGILFEAELQMLVFLYASRADTIPVWVTLSRAPASFAGPHLHSQPVVRKVSINACTCLAVS